MLSKCATRKIAAGRQTCSTRSFSSTTRRSFVCKSTEDPSTPSTSGVIFYAGKSYTDAEWQAAIKSGAVSKDGIPQERTAVTNSTLDSLVEVMAFSGPAPEIANGRLAMLGFVAAAAAELSSGQGVIGQWQQAETPITITFLLFMAASLFPLLKGVKREAFGPFTPDAELLNGRAAMIGFASLLIAEGIRGAALF